MFSKKGANEIYIPIFLFKNNKWEDLNDTIKKLKGLSFSGSTSTLTLRTLYRDDLKVTTNVLSVSNDETSYSFLNVYSTRGDEVLIVSNPKLGSDSYVRYYYFFKFNIRTDTILTAIRSGSKNNGSITNVSFNQHNFYVNTSQLHYV